MFPLDIIEVVKQGLAADRRPPDGKLHSSSHLIGSLRHAMLDVAGAPKIESDVVSDLRLMTGTMWHRYIEDALHAQGMKFKSEIKLDRWMPEGWSGTADWLLWHPEYRAWMLGDLKTIKGEGIQYVLKDGAKIEHLWQLSSYWHALADSGIPLLDEFGVLYLPMNTVPREDVQPRIEYCNPLPREVVVGRMEERWAATQEYLLEITKTGRLSANPTPADLFVNDKLAAVQEREQAITWNAKQEVFDLKLKPHYSASWCSFPDELCDCSTQSVNKIGEYDLDGFYKPRKDYEDIIPLIEPELADYRKRRATA